MIAKFDRSVDLHYDSPEMKVLSDAFNHSGKPSGLTPLSYMDDQELGSQLWPGVLSWDGHMVNFTKTCPMSSLEEKESGQKRAVWHS